MIYCIHHHDFWVRGGVENGQAYRAKIFRNMGLDAKFIYATTFPVNNIWYELSNMGIRDSEIIWLYSFFTNCKISPVIYTLKQLESTFEDRFIRTRKGTEVKYEFPGKRRYCIAHVLDDKSDCVHRVLMISKGCLVREDHYSYCRIYSNYYAPLNNHAHLYLTRFFNEDGTIAYEEIVDDDTIIYRFPDRLLYSREELVSYMMSCLDITEDDVVLIDAEPGIIDQSVFIESAFPAKIGIIIHMNHFFKGYSYEEHILWYPCYEYAFSHSEKVSFYVTSTDVQTDLIKKQFKKYNGKEPCVVTIPVAGLDILKTNENTKAKRYSLITASRLTDQKCVHSVIEAVVQAKKQIPELTLDIYGDGEDKEKLKNLIEKLHCSDYVHLCGYQKLDMIYPNYEAYVSGSRWETFGITLLEAVGAGLPIIGYDVCYGNQIFIDDGENGYRIPWDDRKDESERIHDMAERIVCLFTKADLEAFRHHSYEKAKSYLTYEVEKKWRAILMEKI